MPEQGLTPSGELTREEGVRIVLRLRAAGASDEDILKVLQRQTAFRSGAMQKEIAAANERDTGPTGMEYVKGLAREVGQGALLGFEDEAEAGLRAALGGGEYRDLRDQIRAKQSAFEEANPYTSFAANLAGGLAVPGIGHRVHMSSKMHTRWLFVFVRINQQVCRFSVCFIKTH